MKTRQQSRTKAYLRFLESKIKGAVNHASVSFDESLIHESTKPHQRDVILWALIQERALIAARFGLGKTQIESEIGRLLLAAYPGSIFLVVSPLGVRHQFIDEDGPRLGIKWQYVYDDASIEAADTPFLITNYERIRDGNITPAKHPIIGASLDEGDVIRSLGTKTVDVFRKTLEHIRYRFVATATPDPNDYKELIYFADFLGVMDSGQALTRWFKRNPDKAGDLQIHPQYENDFWLWVSTWALFLYSPADMGYDDSEYQLPELNVKWHCVGVDHTRAFAIADNFGQRKLLISAAKGVTQSAREKRATMPARIAKTREIIETNPDTSWLLWHTLEDERRAIEKEIPDSLSVYGSQDLELRESRVLDFAHGRISRLATKPELSGSGCNFQRHCHSNVFVGVDYRFKDFIQAVHRTFRFLQKHAVDIHIVYAESEQPIIDELRRKWKQYDEQCARMREIIRTYGLDHRLINEELKRKIGVHRVEVASERFTAVNNDCVLEMENVPSDSVGLIHTSIPFGNHYEYTANYEDFGHNENNDRFFAQMDFLIPELLRVLKPGRVAAIHVKDRILYGHQTKSGIMEVDEFSDVTVRSFKKHGFLYEGRRTIVTDVVRENASTYRLGWTEMCKDASKMGSGLPEYLLLFRKAPTGKTNARADEPVAKAKPDYKCARWQFTAHGFWRSDGDVLVPTSPEEVIRYLLDLLSAKDPYDFEAHVAKMVRIEDSGMLPASFMADPPESRSTWVWDDIVMMRSLNSNQSRRQQVNHMCPLPLDIVERTIKLYSNPGDVVFDPFAGLFTVPYCAVRFGRVGHGVELSQDYFRDGLRYCKEIEAEVIAPTLFDLMEQTPLAAETHTKEVAA
jgi:DNA modification methylase